MSWLCIRRPKYWSFNFSISPFNEYSGLISFRMDWFDLLAVQGSLKSLLLPDFYVPSTVLELEHEHVAISSLKGELAWNFWERNFLMKRKCSQKRNARTFSAIIILLPTRKSPKTKIIKWHSGWLKRAWVLKDTARCLKLCTFLSVW